MRMEVKKRALALLLTTAVLSTMVTPAFAQMPSGDNSVPADKQLKNGFSEDPNRYEIYPVPHSTVYPDEVVPFTMTQEVNVVVETGIDQATKDFLEEILTDYGRSMTTSSSTAEGKTNILLGVYGDEDSTVPDPTPAVRTDLFAEEDSTSAGKYDPYMLVADTESNPNGIITIVGGDSDCVYYGLATLQMMFTSFAGQKFLPVQIEDYSNVRFRGFIEGFYGGFDYEGRESQMRSIRDVKGNMYVFASKTDPYHAERWYELYPEEELAQIKHLAEVSDETKVDYAWSVHIGKGGFFNGASSDPQSGAQYKKYQENVEKLKAKFQQLYDVGVRNFHILNDDYNSGTNADVVALLNTINTWLKEKGDCGPIVYCPKGYNVGWAGNGSELNALKGLDSDIYIYWTGSDVNSPINQDNIDWPYEKSGHYPVTWLNYPCSEHDKAGIYLGDISHYVSNADGLTGQMGIISNPVNYPEANKVAYFQLISWGWNRDNYTDYMEALWEDCFKYLQPEVYDSYLTIARNISNCPDSGRISQGFPESEYLKDRLDSVLEKALSGQLSSSDEELESLMTEFTHILNAVDDFRANCTNEALVEELDPWLSSLAGVVTAAQQGLLAQLAVRSGDVNSAWTYLSNASIGLDEWDNYKTPQYADKTAKAGSKRLQPFANELIAAVRDELLPLLSPDGGLGEQSFYAVLGGKRQEDSANSDKIFDGAPGTYASYNIVQQEGDYVGVDLGKVETIRSVDILQGKNDSDHDYLHKATLECSVDGESWVTLAEKVNSHHILVEGLDLAARYVRLRLVEAGYGAKPDYWTNIREFSVKTDVAENTLLYTNLASTEGLSVTEDGGIYTLRAGGEFTLEPGGYVGIRLPEIMGISQITVEETLPEGFVLQTSTNGAVWKDYTSSGDMTVRYIRMVNQSGSVYAGTLPVLSAAASAIVTDLEFESTNMGIHQGEWSDMVDGDRASLVWTNAKQQEGQYVIYDLGSKQPLYDVTLFFPESGDYPHYLSISISDKPEKDGTWAEIGRFDNQPNMDPPYRYYACNGGGQTARYIKLEITKTDSGWIKFNELEVNSKLDQDDPAGAFSGQPGGDFEKLVDGDITTLFAPGQIGMEGGYLQYLISENAEPSAITILQSPSAISDAEVKVQTADESWVSLGTLNQGVCTYDTSDLGALLALRLEWKPGTSPAVAEIVLVSGNGADTPAGTIPLNCPNIYEANAGVTDISVNYGTALDMVGLPERAEVTLSDGSVVSLPVTWSCEEYDPDEPGDYEFVGTYVLDEGLTNPGQFQLTATVTVKPDAEEPVGPQEGNLALKQTVYVSGVEVSGQTGPALAVDGDAETRWSSNKMKRNIDRDAWIVVDLGEDVQSITSISAEYFNKVWPTDYVIQAAGDDFEPKDYSNTNIGTDIGDPSAFEEDNAKDATCWTTLATFTDRTGADHPTDSVESSDFEKVVPEGVRYIRLYFTEMNSQASGDAIGLEELTVMGTRKAPELGQPDVESVDGLTATGVVGTEFSALELPERVVAHLADGTTVRLPVEWDSSDYNSESMEEQTLTGTLAVDESQITNSEGVTATLALTLTVEPAVERVLLNPSSLTAAYGTPFDGLALPEQAVVQLNSGLVAICGVQWAVDSYNPEQLGEQTVLGGLLLPAGVDNPSNVQAKMPVMVKEGAQAQTVTVSFNSNGGTAVPSQTVERGGVATEPAAPSRSGYHFAGWYADGNLTQLWNFSQPVNDDMTLYAKWDAVSPGGSGSTRYTVSVEDTDNGSVKVSPTRASKGSAVTVTVKPNEGYELDELTVTDKNGDSVKLTDKGDGKYTFKMPASKVTVEAVFTAAEAEGLPFTDVTSGDWFYDAVAYVYDKGMMEGTTDTTFAPTMNLTRGMIAQVLYNLEERPEGHGAAGFPDVAAGAWYADAVNWAAARGIVKGYDIGAFGPEDSVTREQLAAILYRYAQVKGYDTTQGGMAVREFSDSASISDWAQEAMAWAVNAQVLSGKGNGVLDPQGTATRAEVAQMLMNFGEHVG